MRLTKSVRRFLSAVLWKSSQWISPSSTTAHPVWVQVQSGPIKDRYLLLDLSDGASQQMRAGNFDKFLHEILSQTKILKEDSVVWDIGAHFGYHSLYFAAMVQPGGRICAFEPNPYVAAHFKKHLDKNPSLAQLIDLREVALSDVTGEQGFRCSPTYSLGTIGHLDNGSLPGDRIAGSTYQQLMTVQVQTVTADSLIDSGEPAPHLIKIDVEGGEVAVIEGARKLLAVQKPALVIEVHNIKNMYLIQRQLLELGYALRYEDDLAYPSSSRAFLFASDEANPVF